MREPGYGADQTSPTLEIPYFDISSDGPVELIDRAPERMASLEAAIRRQYSGLLLRLGDRATARWLARNGNPYHREILEVAARTRLPGAVLLNLSYEWGCTTGVGADPFGAGSRMLRSLDWPLQGIGANVVVARETGNAGSFMNVTWPGFIGVLTAMAPGRFSAAINQPPLRRYSGRSWFDWAINRTHFWRRSSLPPSHLLRRVFEECRTYAEAREMLIRTPVCIPVFALSGVDEGDGCVIERLEHHARVHEAPTSISNHWLDFDIASHSRGTDSVGRRALMEACRDEVPDGFSWVLPPILNSHTRLAVVANAARETLLVRGIERETPVTADFNLQAHFGDGKTRTTSPPKPATQA